MWNHHLTKVTYQWINLPTALNSSNCLKTSSDICSNEFQDMYVYLYLSIYKYRYKYIYIYIHLLADMYIYHPLYNWLLKHKCHMSQRSPHLDLGEELQGHGPAAGRSTGAHGGLGLRREIPANITKRMLEIPWNPTKNWIKLWNPMKISNKNPVKIMNSYEILQK